MNPAADSGTHTGRMIRVARRHACLTQHQLAQSIGVDQSTIAKWEKGVVSPSLSVRRRLAQALEMPFTVLFPEDAA